MRIRTTKDHTKFWTNRKIDWRKSYTETFNHPHRGAITWALNRINFFSLWEVGVGGGANLVRIVKDLPNKQLGGSDISPEAIKTCQEVLVGGRFHVESGDDMLLSDRSVDVILSDMTLIYVGPLKIKKYLKEFRRVARNAVVLCEFHSNSWWTRFLLRIRSGYNAYNYNTLLQECGYYDVTVLPLPEEMWPGDKSGIRHIIIARIP